MAAIDGTGWISQVGLQIGDDGDGGDDGGDGGDGDDGDGGNRWEGLDKPSWPSDRG